MGQVMGIGDLGQQVELPAMPIIGASEQLPTPYPLADRASLTIGWQFKPEAQGGRAFVIIRRGASGRLKVVDSFPLTESGWASAWRAFVTSNPAAAPGVVSLLRQRAADATRLSVPSERAVYEAAGVTKIDKGGRAELVLDDDGVLVRNAFHRAEKFAWPEVSRFADGVRLVQVSGGEFAARWVLDVELRDGQVIPANVTSGRQPDEHLEILAAVRRAAARHGVPAELTGLRVVGGMYAFPDDLLQPPGPDDPAATARRLKIRSAVSASAAAVLLAGAVAVRVWWDPAHHSNYWQGLLILAGLAALSAWVAFEARKQHLSHERAWEVEAELQDDGEEAVDEAEP
jgi:hypothetical protein